MKETQFDIEQEILNKISEIESETYIFPKRFQKQDYIVTIVVAIVCLAGIIWGAFI